MNEKELRNLINEVAAEIIAESPINPGDGEFTEEEGLLLQQLSDDAVEEESLENDDQEMQNSLDAISANEVEGKLSFNSWLQHVLDASSTMMRQEDIEDGFDPVTGEQIMPYDAWLKGADPAIYAQSIDLPGAGDERSDDFLDRFGDRIHDDMLAESKEFTFDKFMTDINGREDKIEQHKKELTENEGDTNARLKQRLYQEDWRNSVKFKGNK